MIGKASVIKTKIVYSGYIYPSGYSNISDRRWEELSDAINRTLSEIGDVEIISISHTSQAHGEGDLHESALIIYKEQ